MRLSSLLASTLQSLERGLLWTYQSSGEQDLDLGEHLDHIGAELCEYGLTEDTFTTFQNAVLFEYDKDPDSFLIVKPSYSPKKNPNPGFYNDLRPSLLLIASELIHDGKLSKIRAEHHLRSALDTFGPPLNFLCDTAHEEYFKGIIAEAFLFGNPDPASKDDRQKAQLV